jgi:hypothetical protein
VDTSARMKAAPGTRVKLIKSMKRNNEKASATHASSAATASSGSNLPKSGVSLQGQGGTSNSANPANKKPPALHYINWSFCAAPLRSRRAHIRPQSWITAANLP